MSDSRPAPDPLLQVRIDRRDCILRGTFVSRSYGYDPLSLGKSPEQVEKYREFEVRFLLPPVIRRGSCLPQSVVDGAFIAPGCQGCQI